MKRLREVFFILIFGLFQYSRFHLFECKKLDGYKFPVYSTEVCPRNQTEWKERSSALNCTEDNGYLCLPNENITELLEFCYRYRFIWIQEGVCLYLKFRLSLVDSYSCSHFLTGCHNASFPSYQLFEYPDCTTIGNGCFLSESSCRGSTFMTDLQTTTERMQLENNTFMWIIFGTVFGTSVLLIVFLLMFIYYRKRNCNRKRNDEDKHENKTLPLAFQPNQSERTVLADEGCLICEGNDHENNHDEEDISPLVPQIESGGLESTDAGMDISIRNDDEDKHEDRELSQRFPPNQPKRLLSDEEDTWSEHLDSQKLRNVLESFKVVIPSNSKNSIARDLLTGPILIELVKEVRDLARSVVFCKNLKEEKKKPGTVYACEVVVKIVDNQVVIYEKEPAYWSAFLKETYKDLVKVILIEGTWHDISKTKKIVYKKYKQYIDSENFHLHHVSEKIDEVAKLSAHQKIISYKQHVESIRRSFPLHSIEVIVNEAANRALTYENIRDVCRQAYISEIGNVYNASYTTHSTFTSNRISVELKHKTIESITRYLGTQISSELRNHIRIEPRNTLRLELIQDVLSRATNVLYPSIFSLMVSIVNPIAGVFVAAGAGFITFFVGTDVNSISWRDMVASEIYKEVSKRRLTIENEFSSILRQNMNVASDHLDTVAKSLNGFRENLDMIDLMSC